MSTAQRFTSQSSGTESETAAPVQVIVSLMFSHENIHPGIHSATRETRASRRQSPIVAYSDAHCRCP